MIALLFSFAFAQDIYIDSLLEEDRTIDEPLSEVVSLESVAHGEEVELLLAGVGEKSPGYSFLISKRSWALGAPNTPGDEVAWGEVRLGGADEIRVRFSTDTDDALLLTVTALDDEGYAVGDGATYLLPPRRNKAANNKSKLRKLVNAL